MTIVVEIPRYSTEYLNFRLRLFSVQKLHTWIFQRWRNTLLLTLEIGFCYGTGTKFGDCARRLRMTCSRARTNHKLGNMEQIASHNISEFWRKEKVKLTPRWKLFSDDIRFWSDGKLWKMVWLSNFFFRHNDVTDGSLTGMDWFTEVFLQIMPGKISTSNNCCTSYPTTLLSNAMRTMSIRWREIQNSSVSKLPSNSWTGPKSHA